MVCRFPSLPSPLSPSQILEEKTSYVAQNEVVADRLRSALRLNPLQALLLTLYTMENTNGRQVVSSPIFCVCACLVYLSVSILSPLGKC